VVLLHNGNRFPSFPLGRAANMKESYKSMKLLLRNIKYDEVKWKLCRVLKVGALLLGMQLGYTKYCCFLRKWDSRDKKNHYVNKLWHKRTSLAPGEKNVVSSFCSSGEKISASFAHKAGPHENLVKCTDKTGRGFQYVRNKFPNVSDAKITDHRNPYQGTDARQTVR